MPTQKVSKLSFQQNSPFSCDFSQLCNKKFFLPKAFFSQLNQPFFSSKFFTAYFKSPFFKEIGLKKQKHNVQFYRKQKKINDQLLCCIISEWRMSKLPKALSDKIQRDPMEEEAAAAAAAAAIAKAMCKIHRRQLRFRRSTKKRTKNTTF